MGQSQNSTPSFGKLITEELPATKEPGFSSVYRKVGVQKMEFSLSSNVNNLLEMYNNSVRVHPDRPAVGKASIYLGYIKVDKNNDANGNEVEERSVQTLTYRKLHDEAYSVGKALIHRKMEF